MFKAKKEGYLHITLFFSLICGVHGYIFSGNSGILPVTNCLHGVIPQKPGLLAASAERSISNPKIVADFAALLMPGAFGDAPGPRHHVIVRVIEQRSLGRDGNSLI